MGELKSRIEKERGEEEAGKTDEINFSMGEEKSSERKRKGGKEWWGVKRAKSRRQPARNGGCGGWENEDENKKKRVSENMCGCAAGPNGQKGVLHSRQ